MLEPAELQQSPSPEPAAPNVAGEASPPPDEGREPSEDRSWWSRFLHTRGHHDDRSEAESASISTEASGNEPIASHQVTLTEEELNERVARQAQSLHDRDVARRNREAAEAERRRLRDEDPWQYAAQDRERETQTQVQVDQTNQLMGLLGHVGRQHDAVSIDPVINALPQQERERILQLPNAGQGLPGRRVIIDEALKSYGRLEYERGYREAQAKLRKDPVFRKSVLAEQRGSYAEPELYPGNGSPQDGLGDDNVSTILRRQYQQR
jgi:hypothetical protein